MEETIRTHRVGSITAGLTLVVYGVLFLLHYFFRTVTFELIFRLWPLILIGLGIEMLLSNCLKEKVVYDKGAIVILILMMVFAMGMAGADFCLRAGGVVM